MKRAIESRRIEFKNSAGDKLSGILDHPIDTEPTAYALFAHCFTCSKNYKAVGNISKTLAVRGIAVLRFDFTGLGESEGEFAETTFSSNVEDLVAAADYMKKHYQPPQLLIGHSLGGTAVLKAAASIESSRAVVTIASPFDPSNLTRLVTGRREQLESRGAVEVTIGGRPFTIKRQFVEDIESTDMSGVIRDLDSALLVMHSPADRVVGIDQAVSIFTAARHPKSYISLDDADHLLPNETDSRYAGNVIAAWAAKYLQIEEL